MLRTTIYNTRWSSQIRTTIRILDTRFTTSLTTTRDYQSSGAKPYEPQLACSHQISHITKPQPGISMCLPSIPSHNSRNVLNKFHTQGIIQSVVDHAHSKWNNPCPLRYCLALFTCYQAKVRCRLPGRSHMLPRATRQRFLIL